MHFDIQKLEIELIDLENQTTKSDFWDDTKNSSKVLKRITELKKKIDEFKSIESELANANDIKDLLLEEFDLTLLKELAKNVENLEERINKLEITTLLSGKYDANNAIVTLHPGAGGTEAQDWVQMLYRMYTRWANDNGYKVEELEFLPGDEAGIKSVTFLVSGDYAYRIFERRTRCS